METSIALQDLLLQDSGERNPFSRVERSLLPNGEIKKEPPLPDHKVISRKRLEELLSFCKSQNIGIMPSESRGKLKRLLKIIIAREEYALKSSRRNSVMLRHNENIMAAMEELVAIQESEINSAIAERNARANIVPEALAKMQSMNASLKDTLMRMFSMSLPAETKALQEGIIALASETDSHSSSPMVFSSSLSTTRPLSHASVITASVNTQRILNAIAIAEPTARKALIEREVSGGNVDLTVTDVHGHNLSFYADNYQCSPSVISQLAQISHTPITRPLL